MANGTLALQLAIRALGVKGKVITTPFSYVATTSSIVWEGCEPVFVDIDADTFNMDPNRIEQAITARTSAILATHCFGNPCDIDAIQAIADRHGLKVIYDAAHCFGTQFKGKSVFAYGDISTTSFHATKLFHTVEGGAVFTENEDLLVRLKKMRNFGHDGPERFDGVGINGKNSEFHAAMGIVVLKFVEAIIERRKEQSRWYMELLGGSSALKFQRIHNDSTYNYAYFPVVFQQEEILLQVKANLEKEDIQPRRYFYPSLSGLNYVKQQNTPESDALARSILCLPVYHGLTKAQVTLIAEIINKTKP
jgi:dTDP-4-amino-4,6-dideoxygalactose transaminase